MRPSASPSRSRGPCWSSNVQGAQEPPSRPRCLISGCSVHSEKIWPQTATPSPTASRHADTPKGSKRSSPSKTNLNSPKMMWCAYGQWRLARRRACKCLRRAEEQLLSICKLCTLRSPPGPERKWPSRPPAPEAPARPRRRCGRAGGARKNDPSPRRGRPRPDARSNDALSILI